MYPPTSSVQIEPSFWEVSQLLHSDQGNLVPIYATLPGDLLTPTAAYLKITNGCRVGESFLLESVLGAAGVARYSFVGADPIKVLRTGNREEAQGDPLAHLEFLLSEYRYVEVPGHKLPSFTGGAIGYIGYDCIRHFEPRTQTKPLRDVLKIPEAVLMICDTIIIFDHVFQTVKVVSHVHLSAYASSSKESEIRKSYSQACAKITNIVSLLLSNDPIPSPPQEKIVPSDSRGESNVGKSGYCRFVTELKKRITQGDIIQAVPSQRLKRKTDLHPFNAYRQLRSFNPSPYMFYVDCGRDLRLVGASPECLVKVEDGLVECHAIAGTIRRGKDAAEDVELSKKLAESTKDRAEHVMLVDLARNDVNRVCDPATVKVDFLMQVQQFSHVIHLTSQVSGRLREGQSRFDAFRSIFPAGTVSGAPKIRAMQLIGELEGETRGVYAGAVGNFNFSRNSLDTCIAIRTMVFLNGTVYFQAGGGIVYDSVEEEEFEETINKLMANVNTIIQAEQYQASLQG
ncbi:hypothetical protein BT69DRAFT_1285147 [Atractiella rhizophila]|nr:hypothetical protein BT69DRAFT_1285147 [Atractiella rhizophila]